jgi:hypothetical protein
MNNRLGGPTGLCTNQSPAGEHSVEFVMPDHRNATEAGQWRPCNGRRDGPKTNQAHRRGNRYSYWVSSMTTPSGAST